MPRYSRPAPTVPAQTMATRRWNPGRSTLPDPDRPRSSSITVTDWKPARSAALARSYCRRWLSRLPMNLAHGRLANVDDPSTGEVVRRDPDVHPRLPSWSRLGSSPPPVEDLASACSNPSASVPGSRIGKRHWKRQHKLCAMASTWGPAHRPSPISLEGGQDALGTRVALNVARTSASRFRPSMLISGGPSSIPLQ